MCNGKANRRRIVESVQEKEEMAHENSQGLCTCVRARALEVRKEMKLGGREILKMTQWERLGAGEYDECVTVRP